MEKLRTAIWDIETDGLLDKLTRIHVLAILEQESQRRWVFRQNARENTIEQGLEMVANAELNVGHNTLHFDIPACEKVYPGFEVKGRCRDTLVMSRLIFPDEKQRDFMRFERGKLPGKLIGANSLDAWGYRLNCGKGDYKAVKEQEAKDKGITDPDEIAAYVWGEWNQEMEDYGVHDPVVTQALWRHCNAARFSEDSIILEHRIHDFMGKQERNGVPFNREDAEKLAAGLEDEMFHLVGITKEHYGSWYAPAKKRIVAPRWHDPEGKNEAKSYKEPHFEHGQDRNRAVWGEIAIPKKTIRYKDKQKGDRTEGCAYTPIQVKEFNPLSRENIIDRFITVYDWDPQEFTETGRPAVNDDVLRTLVEKIPMAEELAEIFFYKKLLGQLKDGAQSWLNAVDDDGMIHHYCNVGGTISGRASHVGPNLGQVPSVVVKDIKDELGNKIGKQVVEGRAGDFGWECRNLFYVPDPYVLLGTDMSGIEFRCLANLTYKYDKGELLDVVLHGDIHEMNREAAGLKSRAQAKTFIYAYIYGAGDWKLGHIADPYLTDSQKIALGKLLRRTFEERIPALGKVVKEIGRQAASGNILGLDGRWLRVRGQHAALNLKLQSDAAVLAKQWILNFLDGMDDAGLREGWGGDWVQLLWVHDELQQAILPKHVDFAKHLQAKAAKDAGARFGFVPPVDVESKIGRTWAQTH